MTIQDIDKYLATINYDVVEPTDLVLLLDKQSMRVVFKALNYSDQVTNHPLVYDITHYYKGVAVRCATKN